MPLDEVFQRDRHLLLYGAGVVNMARDVEELCSRVSLSAEAQKPRAASTTDGGRHGYSLHIGNRCWATEHTFKRVDVRNLFQCHFHLGKNKSISVVHCVQIIIAMRPMCECSEIQANKHYNQHFIPRFFILYKPPLSNALRAP